MPKNKNPAKPKTIAISDCTQNALLSVHVSFSVLASSVPAVFADNSRYANTWSWPKSNQTWQISGKSVAFLEISQTEAAISNREYMATIAFAAKTYLNASKLYQWRESDPLEFVSMKTAEASEKQKAANRKTRMSELNRFSFCTDTVDWKCCWVSPPLRWGCGDRMTVGGTAGNYFPVKEIGRKGGRSHERGKGWRRLLSGIDCKGDTEKLRCGLRGGELLKSRDMTWGFNVPWRERIERKLTWREGEGKNLSNVWGLFMDEGVIRS